MRHRWVGIVAALLVIYSGVKLVRRFGTGSFAGRLGLVWIGMVLAQVALGAMTVWFNKAADVTTLHVVIGACCLVAGAVGVTWCGVASRRAVSLASTGAIPATTTWARAKTC
jgi:cytochrome c oxidase assembly protein subunit 15